MEKNTLNVYCLGGPLLSTEWSSIMGDKYRDHLDFVPVLVATPEEASVIVWDGVVTAKSQIFVRELLENLGDKVVFLMTGEAGTFFDQHPYVKLTRHEVKSVFLPPSRVLPEELLAALAECRRLKSGPHV